MNGFQVREFAPSISTRAMDAKIRTFFCSDRPKGPRTTRRCLSTEIRPPSYNLEEDLGEANNLYNQHPEVVARLKKALEEITTAKK
jgi:hypothetical protein